VFYRSAAKPLQALPLVEERVVERLGLNEAELALCCASHNGEPVHVEGALGILRKAGLGVDALACGPHIPMGVDAAERLAACGERPTRAHNNCSGKHAGMLAFAVAQGWPVEGYNRPEHPVQQRMLVEVARWSELDAGAVATGVDGCGVVCFALPLERMALSFARFARAAREGEGAARVVAAMSRQPHMIAGTGRLCTALMTRAPGRVFVKTGAEGVYCAGVPGQDLGVAIKVLDGARRAADVAIVAVLKLLGVLEPEDVAELAAFAAPDVLDTRGEVVGSVRGVFEFAGAALPGQAAPRA
jgi:L-asparaginase II